MDVQNLTSTQTTPYTAGQSARTSINSDYETFLRMLTTQIKNQDPLNPDSASDFAVQLATFSGVEQQVRTNDLLTAMSAQLNVSGLSQMADWVGRDVRVPVAADFKGSPIGLSLLPEARADRVELVVMNSAGIEVQRIAVPKNSQDIDWAGVTADGAPLPSGQYSFALENWLGEQLLNSSTPEVYARVSELRAEGGAIRLILEGGQSVDPAQVSALRGPRG